MGEASEVQGMSFGDMAKTAGAAAIGTAVATLAVEGGKRLIFGKPVFGDKDGQVVIQGDVVDLKFNSPEHAEKVADTIKEQAKAAREKAEKEAKEKKDEKSEKKDEESDKKEEAA
jgi:ribosomal 50S subunit-recycling heat shock protein